MAYSDLHSPEILRKLLRYTPETGDVYWIERDQETMPVAHRRDAWNTRHAGQRAFHTPSTEGYLRGKVFGKFYSTHRLVWAMHYGEWPTSPIDHINGNRADNRITNLRVVPISENNKNSCRRSDNSSGSAGVVWCRTQRKWRAGITLAGKFVHLGRFKTIEDAVAARQSAQLQSGFTERHGR